jgi:hypothetical protein
MESFACAIQQGSGLKIDTGKLAIGSIKIRHDSLTGEGEDTHRKPTCHSVCGRHFPNGRPFGRWAGSSLGFQSVAPVDYL